MQTSFVHLKKIAISVLILAALPTLGIAASMTNNIEGVGPNDSIKPFICIQNSNSQVTYALAPGESIDANIMSGNAYYVGATLRFDGCSSNDSYLGYIGFNLNESGNNSIDSYQPPEGVHIAFEGGKIDGHGNVTGKINYTAIEANFDLPQGQTGKNWQFNGINLAGLEFSDSINPTVIPNLSAQDEASENSDLSETSQFIQQGVNTVRVPVRWGYLQLDGPGQGDIYLDYYNNYVRPTLQSLTSAKVHTIVDLHAYMRYAEFGKQHAGCSAEGPCPDGTLITDSNAYQDIWSKLYALMKNDPKINQDYLMLDLVNEPVGVPNDKVLSIQTDVIKMLRQQGFKGYILVEGNSWTGLHSWTTYQWLGEDGTPYTNASLFSRDNFKKAGVSDLSKILINVHQYLDSDYSGTHDTCLQDLSTTGVDGFNLNAFIDYLQQNQLKAIVTEFGTGRNASSCRAPLTTFMNYLKDNSAQGKNYGFAGWTIWSTGHGWGDYNLRVTPESYQMNVLKEYL